MIIQYDTQYRARKVSTILKAMGIRASDAIRGPARRKSKFWWLVEINMDPANLFIWLTHRAAELDRRADKAIEEKHELERRLAAVASGMHQLLEMVPSEDAA